MKEQDKKTRRFNLSLKVGTLVGVFSFCLIVAISIISYSVIRNQTLEFYSDKVSVSAVTAAKAIDGSLALEALETKEYSSKLQKQLEQLDVIKDANDLKYLYLFTINEEGINYIYTALKTSDNPEDAVEIGYFEKFENGDAIMKEVLESKEASNSLNITGGNWGYVASSFAPVLDEQQNAVALVGADYDMKIILSNIRNQVITTAGIAALIVILMIAILVFMTNRTMIQPIQILTKRASEMVKQSTDTEDVELVIEDVVLKNRDEIGTLGDAFNEMAHNIEHYVKEIQTVTADKKKIETELGVAKKIQEMFLPRLHPPFSATESSGFSIYASMQAAKAVGGDFYDFYMIDKDHVALTIADVSGKGVPAALFMALSKTILKNQVLAGKGPAQAMIDSNNQLMETNEENMFVTVFLGILELSSGLFTYANAGHNLPLIYSAKEKKYNWLQMRPNLVLAAMEGLRFKEHSLTFQKGDRLLLYTDGVTEAMNEKDELYGDPRLLEFSNEHMILENQTIEESVEVLKKSLVDYRGNAEQSDDITILLMKYEGKDE